jgi:hypothetical protein
MILVGHAARMSFETCIKVARLKNLKRKYDLGDAGVDNLKINVKKIGSNNVVWIHLAQIKVLWRAL